MHDIDVNFDLSLDEISKIEGSASLILQVRDNKIENLEFSISEWKRFYTQAIQGKPYLAVPQLLSRICGTCSNAHLLASLKSVENAFGIVPSQQTMNLRKLLQYGLIIRDHALHLYIFTLPDYFGRNSILDFDENDPLQKQLLEDAFSVKEIGNRLSIIVGGRSVHAPQPTIGGFLKLPNLVDLKTMLPKLEEIRPKLLKLIDLFAKTVWELKLNEPLLFSSLVSPDFSFLEGTMKSSEGTVIGEGDLRNHLNVVVIPYSHAKGFTYDGKPMMVGALARLNIDKTHLHVKTMESVKQYLSFFPSNNLYLNNLAQAIEILHAVDASYQMIEQMTKIDPEIPQKPSVKETVGVGVIEAPRGTLYHKLEINTQGVVVKGEIIVPTGQNQIIMEKGIRLIVESGLEKGTAKEEMVKEIEKFIRAFDPCMSCATHFLKVKWK